jgi:hypothetical protein
MIGGHVVMPRTNAGRASTDCSGLLQLRACWHHRWLHSCAARPAITVGAVRWARAAARAGATIYVS